MRSVYARERYARGKIPYRSLERDRMLRFAAVKREHERHTAPTTS